MAFEITVPRLGWSMEEGTFVRWLKTEGEPVRMGEPLLEIEGEKAVQEIEAGASGVLRLGTSAPAPGEKVRVGAVLGYLLEPGEAMPGVTTRSATASATASTKSTVDPRADPTERVPPVRAQASPRARRFASAHRVDLASIHGTGRGGRIRERDVEAASRGVQPATAATEDVTALSGGLRCDLRGRVALVTGSARGIGQAIADRFAANGATVYYSDLEGAAGAAARTGGESLCLDVTKPESIRAGLDEILRRHGRLDIVVNNAGVNTMKHRVTIDEFPREEWDRILAVDLTGLFEVSRAAAAILRRQNSGRIINIASIAGLVPLRLQCAFTAAKAGVVNLTRAMAIELGQFGILVNAIAPGSTLTDGTKQLFYGPDGKFSDRVQRMLDHVPLSRPGTVDEIAVAALFLAAPDNSYMTGHILTVDGGWTAGYTRDF